LKPVLLIPVYRGGGFLDDCLASVSGKESDFEQIVISINGGALERAIDRKAVFSSDLAKDNLVVFETDKPLSTQGHMRFILRQLRLLGLKSESQVMNLFHDDWLLKSPGVDLVDSGTVVAGDWEKTEKPSPVSAVEGSSQSVKDWLWNSGRKQIFVNGSGMISTLGAREEASKILSFFNTGVRYEHLLITHRTVKTVKSSSPALVRIRVHEAQDGSNQTAVQALRGDLAFSIWLIIQGRFLSWKELRFVLGAIASSFISFVPRVLLEVGSPKIKRD
jgi:hypothetical protein